MLAVIFWLSLFLICSSYFGYPLILMVLGLAFGRAVKRADITPLVSLLIPVYNEEKVIAKKIENCLSLDYPREKLELVVASESTDKTNEIISSYQEKGVKLFAYSEREGQSPLIYKTFPRCRGEIVVLSDADATLKQDAVRKLVRNFADPKIGCVCGQLEYANSKESLIGQSKGLHRQGEIFIKKLESKIQSVLGAEGPIYALRRELHAPLSKYRGGDFELPIRIRQMGYGVIFEPEAIAFEESLRSTNQEFKRRIRIVSMFFKTTLMLLWGSVYSFEPILILQIFFRKVLRWLVPLFLLFIFLSNIFLLNKLFYQMTMFCQIIFYGVAILAWRREKQNKKLNIVFNVIHYFFMANLAISIGLVKGAIKKKNFTWDKIR